MAASLEQWLRAGAGTATEWARERGRQAAGSARDLEAIGRDVYRGAVRTGQQVKARTEAELRDLGRQAEAQAKRAQTTVEGVVQTSAKRSKPPPSARPTARQRPAPSPKASQPKPSPSQQARAAVSGAVDEASFGVADYVSAGLQALGTGKLADIPEQFSRELAEERAQDAYDAQHHGLARGAGQAVGFVGSLVATGGAGAATKVALKAIPKVTRGFERASRAANSTRRIMPLTPSGMTTIAVAGGAGSGVIGQGVSDALSGRISELGDYGGAALGGAAGGLTTLARLPGKGRITEATNRLLRDPMLVGGVEGAATGSLQSILTGEDIELVEIARNARNGAVGARAGDVIGKYGANALDKPTKERLGETLSIIKTVASGGGNPLGGAPVPDFDQLLPGVTPRGKTPGGPGRQRWLAVGRDRHTRADFVTNRGKAIEAKMGAYARPTDPQKLALKVYAPDQYRVLHWLPWDLGRAGGVLGGALVGHGWDTDEP